MLIIEPIKAFDDNYIWLMTKNNKSVVVDPGDASEIVKLIDNQAINLEGVLITHHHYDHTNGLSELIEKKNLKVFGPRNNISEINNIVGDSDQFDLIGIHFEVLEIPGHTLDHIAFYTFNNGNPVLLCGEIHSSQADVEEYSKEHFLKCLILYKNCALCPKILMFIVDTSIRILIFYLH